MARFIDRAVGVIWFCPSVASTTAPSRAELNAGTVLMQPNLTAVEGIATLTGFDSAVNFIAVPDGNSTFDKTIPGTTSASSPQMEFYSDKVAKPIQTALAENTIGYLVMAYKGDVVGYPAQVWHVQIGGNNEMPDLGNNAHKFKVQFAVLDAPVKNAVVPA
jgi:hypothetical protein